MPRTFEQRRNPPAVFISKTVLVFRETSVKLYNQKGPPELTSLGLSLWRLAVLRSSFAELAFASDRVGLIGTGVSSCPEDKGSAA